MTFERFLKQFPRRVRLPNGALAMVQYEDWSWSLNDDLPVVMKMDVTMRLYEIPKKVNHEAPARRRRSR